jgi:hypothetical protein
MGASYIAGIANIANIANIESALSSSA